ncbi:MAG: DsrE family protein [Nanoarchaeota archaeon]|nr:DsrE family protein [Nanoarchaeota archaeon]
MEKVLVHTTWGPTDPTRAGLAFAYAMVSKKQGAEVEMFLFHDAVLLARKQMYPLAVPIGPPPIKDCMEYLLEQKVKIYVCKPCYELRGMDEKDLVEMAELKGMDYFVELAKTSKVVSF